jgi:3-oxoadipate enol-lactonase
LPVEVRSVQLRPGRLAYDRVGRGPVVVFLHGIGGNRTNWAEQLLGLASDFTCIAWDALGYGDSDDPEPGCEFAHFAEELLGLLNHLSVSRAHLVGLSMGGHIALDFLTRHAERVATVTLASTSAGMGALSDEARRDFLAKRLDPLLCGVTPTQIAGTMVEILAGRLANEAIRERLRQSLSSIRKAPYMDTVRAIIKTDFRTTLASISMPTLVLVGEDDRVLPPSESEFLVAHIPAARFFTFENAGHICNIEAAQMFNSVLKKFLSEFTDLATSLEDT